MRTSFSKAPYPVKIPGIQLVENRVSMDFQGEEALRRGIIEISQRLYQRNMLAAADGNISVRLSDDRILITPSGVSKASCKPEELAIITLNNQIISGKPSSERLMHLEVYLKCPKAVCVVHAHPPTAIAWTVARPDLSELPAFALSEVILAVGRIPIAPYARPGGIEMAQALSALLPKHRAMILARHGALSWGESLEEALNGMERIEHVAIILAKAEALGGITSLPEKELAALYALRETLGERSL